MDSTSSGLINRSKQGDAAAWQELTDIYGRFVYSWCRRYDLSPPDSADIVQEVFAAVAQKFDSFQMDRADSTFRGWLWTITRNKIRDVQRKRALSGTHRAQGGSVAQKFLSDVPDATPDESIETNLYQVGQSTALKAALQSVQSEFAEKTWLCFWRCVVDDQTTAEVADELNLSKNAVRQYKSRVFKRLRERIGDLPSHG